MKFIGSILFFGLSILVPAQLITASFLKDDKMTACGGKPTQCPDKVKIVNTSFDVSPDKAQLFGARCCSATQFHLSEQKNDPKCNGIWASSKDPDHQCMTSGTYDDAVAHCAKSNAKLCTCNDLLNKCAKGTGCALNKEMVWCDP